MCVHRYMCRCVCVCVHVHVCVCVHVYICVCVCVCVHTTCHVQIMFKHTVVFVLCFLITAKQIHGGHVSGICCLLFVCCFVIFFQIATAY